MLAVLSAKVVSVLAQGADSGAWTTLAPMPLARQEISCAALDGKIYVIAGFNKQRCLDVGCSGLRSENQQLEPRDAAAHCQQSQRGSRSSGPALQLWWSFQSGVCLQLWANAWSEVAPMRFDHGNTAAVAVIDNRIYVAGGHGVRNDGQRIGSL
jgi:hypothetical protein